MQVIVCPKCGRENQPTSASCFNCYKALAGVVPTESTKTNEAVPVVQPRPRPTTARTSTPSPGPPASGPAPLAGQPLSPDPAPFAGPPPQGQSICVVNDRTREMAPPSPSGPPPGTYAPARAEYPARKEKDRVGTGLAIFLVLLVVGSLGACGWYFYSCFTRPLTPVEVVERLSDPVVASDWNKLKKYLSKSTVSSLVAHYGSEDQVALHIKHNAGALDARCLAKSRSMENQLMKTRILLSCR